MSNTTLPATAKVQMYVTPGMAKHHSPEHRANQRSVAYRLTDAKGKQLENFEPSGTNPVTLKFTGFDLEATVTSSGSFMAHNLSNPEAFGAIWSKLATPGPKGRVRITADVELREATVVVGEVEDIGLILGGQN